MKTQTGTGKISLVIISVILVLFVFANVKTNADSSIDKAISFLPPDTVYIEKIIHDTVEIINYVDTTPIVVHKKAFLYIKDTFNIEDRTYYITELDDTVKVFYFDYTYYIFNYTFQDTLVKVDSVIGCDLFTHCLCDERERVVVFHTCDGETRTIVNMLNKKAE